MRPPHGNYARRVLAAGAGVVALLAVAALGTRGSVAHVRGSGVRADARLPNSLAIAILAVMLAVACAALYVFVTERAREGRGPRIEGPRTPFAIRVLAACVPLFVLGLFAFVAFHEKRLAVPQRDRAQQVSRPARPHREAPRAHAPAGPSIWPPLAVLALLAGAGGAAYVVVRRRGARGPLEPLRRRAPAPAPEALPDPAAVTDPRAAVIAAFARLEAELAAAGLGRRDGEGPLEFTERVAASRPAIARGVRVLARAYAPARFSEHEVDAAARRDALVALDAVRHGLGEPAAA